MGTNVQEQFAPETLAAAVFMDESCQHTILDEIKKMARDAVYPIGSLYGSVNPANPTDLFGEAWLPSGSFSGVYETNYVWKRIAFPSFEVVNDELLMHVPDYMGDAQLSSVQFSLNEAGELMVTLPDGFSGISFSITENGEVEAQIL